MCVMKYNTDNMIRLEDNNMREEIFVEGSKPQETNWNLTFVLLASFSSTVVVVLVVRMTIKTLEATCRCGVFVLYISSSYKCLYL